MTQNKLRKNIELVGLNYKKEIAKISLINFILIGAIAVLFYFYREIIVTMSLLCFVGVINYFLFSFYNNRKRQMEKEHDEEFIALISYFQTFITNQNNVYQSFGKLLTFSSFWMKEKLECFMASVDADKSVKPFIDFANNFTLSAVKNIMLSIYQMVDQGENSNQLTQFLFLFQTMTTNFNNEQKERKKKSLENLTAFPLFGAGAIVLILSISIISVVGEMVNVL